MAYSTKTFIKAIPGTGGIISRIADRVECSWNTAKDYCENYPTVNKVWLEEKSRVRDMAKGNVIDAIKKKDLPTSKWFLQLTDDEFMPKSAHELTGAEGKELVDNDGYNRSISSLADAVREIISRQSEE